MTLFSNPTEHAANPPETWAVVKVRDRSWQLQTKDGSVLSTAKTKREATADADRDSFYVRLYEADRRWYAGETPPGMRSWLECLAEQERTARRVRHMTAVAGIARVAAATKAA
jgi:hypothetical protein